MLLQIRVPSSSNSAAGNNPPADGTDSPQVPPTQQPGAKFGPGRPRRTHPQTENNSRFPNLKIETDNKHNPNADSTTLSNTPATVESGYSPYGQQQKKKNGKLRGRTDIRSPGAKATPSNNKISKSVEKSPNTNVSTTSSNHNSAMLIPDFVTQTDKNGNAITPRHGPTGLSSSARGSRSSSRSKVANSCSSDDGGDADNINASTIQPEDTCDAFLESLRMMCCCLLSDDKQTESANMLKKSSRKSRKQMSTSSSNSKGEKRTMLLPMDPNDPNRVKLLPKIHPLDKGKKCLVLDLDETLVHSSFRAVPGADFVIPVQIEDVVHFVYVAKRPGVDEFLLEMAKHYEIIVYTASLNKYADPLLDLLDPHRVIRTRLFRESCVYFEGNYVKDLSLIDRDLTQSIIVDNSPNSYIFHPENAIDCSSFIDDPADRELAQIGGFLTDIRAAEDVRGICGMWKNWPDVDLSTVEMMQEKR